MKKTTENWLALADYDLVTAEAMFKTRRYFYVVFCCQQAIEKMLKGIIAEKTEETPPYIHNLVRLREKTFSSEEWPFEDSLLRDLTDLYTHNRYAEDIVKVSKQLTREFASATLGKTKEIVEWLKQKLI